MASHFFLLVLFSFFSSLVFALLVKDDPGDQFRFGLLMFGGMVCSAVLLGWLMFSLPI